MNPLYGSVDAVVLTGTRSLPPISSGVPMNIRPPIPVVGAGGGESGVQGGEVWFGAQMGGLIGVTTAQGGLLTSEPGDGLQGNGVRVGHGGLTVGGGLTLGGDVMSNAIGQSPKPEFGRQRTRIAVSISPARTSTFGRYE